MTLEQFAEQYNVKTKRDDCGDTIVLGKVGHIADGYSGNRFGVCIMLDTRRQWTAAKRRLLDVGMTIRQDGDTEGIATFDGTDRKQSRAARKVARVRNRRQVPAPSPAQLAARQAFADRSRAALQLVEDAPVSRLDSVSA